MHHLDIGFLRSFNCALRPLCFSNLIINAEPSLESLLVPIQIFVAQIVTVKHAYREHA